MWKSPMQDGIFISGIGAVIAAAPAGWYPIVWPDVANGFSSDSAVGWVFVFALSISPFVLVSYLRVNTSMHRVAAAAAGLAVGVLVVLGQIAGLNPNDPSSTASIALGTTPILAGVVALAICGADVVITEIVRTYRRRLEK